MGRQICRAPTQGDCVLTGVVIGKMKIRRTRFDDVYVVELEPLRDERGFFARTFCAQEFEAAGLNPRMVQCSISSNNRRGTLRGLHFQHAPHQEAKLIRCMTGAIFDVVVDIRRDSKTFGEWLAFELTPDNLLSLYVGEDLAHGFQTIADNSLVLYAMSREYHSASASGVRWDDPQLAIRWPIVHDPIISERDTRWPFLEDAV